MNAHNVVDAARKRQLTNQRSPYRNTREYLVPKAVNGSSIYPALTVP